MAPLRVLAHQYLASNLEHKVENWGADIAKLRGIHATNGTTFTAFESEICQSSGNQISANLKPLPVKPNIHNRAALPKAARSRTFVIGPDWPRVACLDFYRALHDLGGSTFEHHLLYHVPTCIEPHTNSNHTPPSHLHTLFNFVVVSRASTTSLQRQI